jgi:hypothetical protein
MMTPERQVKDLEMMRHPEHWPLEYLPLKRYKEPYRMEFSMLAKPARDFYHWVYEGQLPGQPDFTSGRLGGDELLVELVNNGWTVD